MSISGGVVSPAVTRPNISGQIAALNGRPYPVGSVSTAAVAKDSWRYAPFRLTSDWAIDQLIVNTTAAASGGTAALIFGLFVADATGRPAARSADYSSFGSIDLTATAGALVLSTPALTLPAGEWYLGYGWAGTASGNPTFTAAGGVHPQISSATFSASATGYTQSISGASVPSSATVGGVGIVPLVSVRMA